MGFRAIKIDTLSLVKELEDSGIPKSQAEAQLRTTIKVLDMVTEEKLATKHDLTHGLHQLEEKLSSKIEKVDIKIDHVEEKLSAKIHKVDIKIDHVEEKLSAKIHKVDIKIDHVEEKLCLRMDKLDEKFSLEITGLKKDIQEVKDKTAQISSEMKQLFHVTTTKLGGIVVAGIAALAALCVILKFFT